MAEEALLKADQVVVELGSYLSIQQPDDQAAATKEPGNSDEKEEEEEEEDDDEELELWWQEEEQRDDEMCRIYRPLHMAALDGDWESAKRFIAENPTIDITKRVTRTGMTILHVAANMGHAVFIDKLLKSGSFPKAALKYPDVDGCTALHYAASFGSLKAVEFLVSADSSLTQIADVDGDIPLCSAADGKASREVIRYLTQKTIESDDCPDLSPFSGFGGADLITSLVAVGHYDICLDLLTQYPDLADDSVTYWQGQSSNTKKKNWQEDSNADLLYTLLCRPSEFPSQSKLRFWERCIYHAIPMEAPFPIKSNLGASHPQPLSTLSKVAKVIQWIVGAASKYLEYTVPGFKRIRDEKFKHICFMQLLHVACESWSKMDVNEIVTYFIERKIHYAAAKHGETEILRAFMRYFPDIMDDVDVEVKILIKAIKHRQEHVYNMMMERGTTVKFLPIYINDNSGQEKDTKDNSGQKRKKDSKDNVLHLVAKLASDTCLSSVSCPAFQMQRELQWFKGVEKFVHPSMKIMPNEAKHTPRESFTIAHQDLVKEAEKWMKETSGSCLVVATLIITVVFAAAFTIPGGLKDDANNPGVPLFLKRRSFVLFVTSDALGMFSSATSIFMFLSILTARYSEDDFLYALPKRLMLGLVSLLIAIASMMIAFGATLFLILDPSSELIVYPIIALSAIPVFLFIMLQLPLIYSMLRSTYGPSILKDKKSR